MDDLLNPGVANLDAPEPTAVPWALVYDTNADALIRRVGVARSAAPDHHVLGFTSVTALMLHAQAAPPGTSALIDLYDADRSGIDRPGDRIIARLRGAAIGMRLVAWTAHVSPDVLAGARDAGADAIIVAGFDPAAEAGELAAALSGGEGALRQVGGPSEATQGWAEPFRIRYGLTWEAWMEPALVRLATTGERAAHAFELWSLGAAGSRAQGVARLRQLAQAMGGERYRNTALVSREANLVLARIASERALTERPSGAASLVHAVEALEREPSLAVAAHLSEVEVADLMEQWAAIRAARAAEPAAVGARPAGWADAERLHAAGRRAAQLGASRAEIDAVAAGVIARTERSLLAIAEAQRDALYAPEARAAAALYAQADIEPSSPIDGVERTAHGLRWRGHSALDLARRQGEDPVELRALTQALDLDLVRRR